ncbi:helix-turn-helix domain-containing protein [Metabacillus sp. Hm71]|uniref:helix-turn-helix domain-containing protein n=1 Tax=Metabacillus sp. Hm71 TaxID=3450743 RepID=UPI003F429F39
MGANVGDLLRLKRLEKKHTLEQIASLVGVSINYIKDLEKGNKSNPSDEIIVRLAEVLNLDEDELFLSFNKTPLSIQREIEQHPSLVKALSQINDDDTLSKEEKEEFYNRMVYWYRELAKEKLSKGRLFI